jgi:glyoxylase-like metal-dependent hydrolase (beta-lactamase superfamily II)
MVNATLIIGDKSAVLVDTGFTHAIGRHLRAAVERITDKPVSHVINTHHHGDHHLGNTAFPEAEIISSEKCRELAVATEAEWIDLVQNLTGMTFPDTRVVPASRTYQLETRTPVTLAGVPLVLWVPQGSHTPGDMIVVLPEDRVLIAGDILVHKMMPNFRDGHVKSWVDTLEAITREDVDVIVPGHGPLMSPADAAAMHRRMAALYAAVEAGYKAGLMDYEIRERMDLSEWRKLPYFDDMMGGNISRTYLELEQASF